METISVHSSIRDEPQRQSIAERSDGVGHGAATVAAYTVKIMTRKMNGNVAWATVSSGRGSPEITCNQSQEKKSLLGEPLKLESVFETVLRIKKYI